MTRRGLIAACRRARRGSVAVEAALAIVFVLTPLCFGAADLGLTFATQARLDQAMEAAILFAWGNATSASPSAIQTVAQSAYGTAAPSLAMTTPVLACYCLTIANGQETQTASACGATCASGQMATYLALSLSASLTLPMPLPALPSPITLTSAGMVRIQ